jgi:ribose 5-phosphate isomerase RpiB
LAHSILVASKSREHNDSNVISLGSWVNSVEENIKILSAWLGTKFGEG